MKTFCSVANLQIKKPSIYHVYDTMVFMQAPSYNTTLLNTQSHSMASDNSGSAIGTHKLSYHLYHIIQNHDTCRDTVLILPNLGITNH